MSIRWWLKVLFVTVLLMGASYFFGTVSRQMGTAYALLLPPSVRLWGLLLRLLLACGVMAVAAGLVAALFRPLRVAFVAIALSGVALLLGERGSLPGAFFSLLYVLAGMVYAYQVQNELRQRVGFSVRVVAESQMVLLVALLVVALGSFYLGYRDYINREGFSIPTQYVGQVSERLSVEGAAFVPEIFRDGIRTGVKKQVQYTLTDQFRQWIKPFERFIPIVAAVLLFVPLFVVMYLLNWVPAGVLWVVLLVLKVLGVLKVTTETQVVKRLVIGT